MNIRYLGHACFLIEADNGKKLVMDPVNPKYGYVVPKLDVEYVTISHEHQDHNETDALGTIGFVCRDLYPHGDDTFQISGCLSFHDEQQGMLRGENRIYKIDVDGFSIVHMGDIGEMPTAQITKFVGNVDVLLIPVGGVFTIDAKQAGEIIDRFRPKYVIPMHYRTPKCSLQQLETRDMFEETFQGEKLYLTGTKFHPSHRDFGTVVAVIMDYEA